MMATLLRAASAMFALVAALASQRLVVTCDTTDCACWRTPGKGGLARRAGTLAELRKTGPLLAVELGGTISGSMTSARTGGRLAAELLAHARYDAVVLASPDLLLPDLDGLLAMAVPWVSANAYRDGKRLAAPYVLAGDVAIIGVTDVAARGVLPAGIEVRDPIAEVAAVLAELGAVPVKKTVIATALAIFDVEALPGTLRLCRGGSSLTRPAVEVRGVLAVAPTDREIVLVEDIAERPHADPNPIARARYPHRTVTVTQALDDGARGILERHGLLPAGDAAPPATPDEPTVEAGGPARAQSRAVEFEVHGFKLQPSYAKVAAPAGGTLVLVDTQWRNVLPLGLVYGQLKSTSYQIPDLRDHAYLVADGGRVLRVAADAHGSPGHIPVRDFALPDLGSTRRGWLAFVAGGAPQHSLELRVYDFAHGHLFVPLWGTPPPPPEPLAPLQANEVLEAGVFGLRMLGEWQGQPAPPGKNFVAVDLRARSRFTQEVDAQAFDPHAGKGAKMQLGTVADWTDAHRYAQLVADGEYGVPPLPSSPLGDAPRFLPDVLGGAEFVFLAPAEAKVLALRCDFPNARLPGGAAPIRPKGLTFALRGDASPPPAGDVIGGVDDDVFRVELIACDAGADGADRIVTCTVRVRVRGDRGEVFQTRDQLLLALPDGSLRPYDADASAALRWAPAPALFVPGASQRAFAVAFRAPAAGKLRLGYRGLTLQHFFDLPLAATPPASSPTTPQPQPQPQPEPPPQRPPAAPSLPEPKTPAVPEARPIGKPSAPAVAAPDAVPPTPRGLAGVGLTPAQVNAAIDRGADGLWAFLLVELRRSNAPYGYVREHLLTSLALVHANLHRREPAFDAALKGQLQRVEPVSIGTYELGLLCMLIEHYGDPAFLPKLHLAARLLFEGQGPKGSWDYHVDVAPERLADPEAEQALKVYGGVPLDGDLPPWTRIEGKNEDGDNSVTQYALLGLRAAANAGVPLPADLWQRALANQRARQQKDGGWPYHESGVSYGSMTAAGVAALAICRHALGEGSPLDDAQVKQGLAWLAQRFSVTKHPEQYDWDFYWLYSLERVGRLLGLEFVGAHEWYPLGARSLVDRQEASGMWPGLHGHEKGDPRLPTAFALLFLTRATEALSPIARRGGEGTLRASVAMPAALRLYLVLDASGSMLEPMAGKPRFESAREAVYMLLDALPDGAEVALRVYGHRKRAVEPGAEDDTELLVPWAKLDRAAMRARIAGLRARGRTPLTLSLQQAASEVGSATADRPVTFVLLTDGGDDTKQRGALAEAAQALTARAGVQLHVVGFAIDRPDWTEQLRKTAVAAGGTYVPASDAAGLAQTLRTVVFGIPDGFSVRGTDGKERAGRFGDALTLPEGKYEVAVSFGEQRLTRTAWINTGGHTGIVFDARRLGR